MTQYKYNFKKFFKSVEKGMSITDDQFVTNGHFIVKKEYLRKPQKDFIESEKEGLFAETKNTEQYIKTLYKVLDDARRTSYIEDSTEFVPVYLGTEIDKATSEKFKVVMTEDYMCIKEEYYNFIKDIKGKIFYYPKLPVYTGLPIYKNNEMIGLIFGVKPCNAISDKAKYKEVAS